MTVEIKGSIPSNSNITNDTDLITANQRVRLINLLSFQMRNEPDKDAERTAQRSLYNAAFQNRISRYQILHLWNMNERKFTGGKPFIVSMWVVMLEL